MGKKKFSKENSVKFKLVDPTLDDVEEGAAVPGQKILEVIPPKQKEIREKLEGNENVMKLLDMLSGAVVTKKNSEFYDENVDDNVYISDIVNDVNDDNDDVDGTNDGANGSGMINIDGIMKKNNSLKDMVEIHKGEKDGAFVISFNNALFDGEGIEEEEEQNVDPDILEALEGKYGYEEIEDNFFGELVGKPVMTSEKGKNVGNEEQDFIFDFNNDNINGEFGDVSGSDSKFLGGGDDDDNGSDGQGFDDDDEEEEDSRESNGVFDLLKKKRSQNDAKKIDKKQLDAEFEKVLEEYDDEQIGNLDGHENELKGDLDVNSVVDNYLMENDVKRVEDLSAEQLEELEKLAPEGMILLRKGRRWKGRNVVTKDEIKKINHQFIKKQLTEQDSTEDDAIEFIQVPKRDKWDCESIISTYSNLYNHPTLIVEEDEKKKKKKSIKLSQKTGIPLGVLESSKTQSNQQNTEEFEHENVTHKTLSPQRIANESKEEKKMRKKMQKEQKKVKREQKRVLKNAFKEEFQRQKSLQSNPQTLQKVVVKY